MKKWFAALLVLMLLCLSSALAELPCVVDNAHLFTESEKAEMTDMIREMRRIYQIDGVVLTTRLGSMSEYKLKQYADVYFEDQGYGLGSDRSGFLFMIDMGNRYMNISTAGIMLDYLSDDRIEECLEAGMDALTSGHYGIGTTQLLSEVRRFLDRGIEEGSFRFDSETGERLSGLYNKLTGGETILSLIGGLAAAILLVLGVSSKYNLSAGTYHFNRSTQTNVQLYVDDQQFLRQTVTRHRTPPPSSGSRSGGGSGSHGGTSVHRSPSGMSHGGGGRHF